MIYISCSAYIEAKKIIKEYNLMRDKRFSSENVYAGEGIMLIITGMGQVNSVISLTRFFEKNDVGRADYFINFGCVAGEPESADKLLLAVELTDEYTGRTFYVDMTDDYYEAFLRVSLVTVGRPVKSERIKKGVVYDMEAAGIYQAVIHYFSPDRMIFAKYVSDSGVDGTQACFEPLENVFAGLKELLGAISESTHLTEVNNMQKKENRAIECAEKLAGLLDASTTTAAMIKNVFLFNCSLGYDSDELYERFVGKYNLLDKPVTRRAGKAIYLELEKSVKAGFKL